VANFSLSHCFLSELTISKNLKNEIPFSSSSSKEDVNTFIGNTLLKL